MVAKTGFEKQDTWTTALNREKDKINKRLKGNVPDVRHPTIFTTGPKGSRTADSFSPNTPPTDWPGTRPEWMVYNALKQEGKSPEIDFSYQSSLLGGRSALGGIVADFLFFTQPLVINVQGGYYHFVLGGVAKQASDVIQRAQMTSLGYTVVYIDEQDIDANVDWYVHEALGGRDHSMGVH